MLRRLLPLLLFCAAAQQPAWLSAAPPRAAAVEPPLPLPGEDDPESPLDHSARKAFELVPRRVPEDGDAPLPRLDDPPEGPLEPPMLEDPVEPAPAGESLEQLQDIEAPGAPSDGEPMPAMPIVPGLVLPKFRPAPLPGAEPPSVAPGPDSASSLLPAPEIQLAQKTRWIRSPYQARRAALEEGKPLLIFFAQLINGSGPSASLNDDLLASTAFNEFAAARLICTKLQYPTSRSPGGSYTEEKLAVLEMVQKKFKVRGFPVIIMLDDRGHEIERISGYSRVKYQGSEVAYSSAPVLLDRLKEADRRFAERKRYHQERVARLTEQGYRTWYSLAGTSLMAKLIRAEPEQITLVDENGAWRAVHPAQLRLYDAEWARRKQAGLLVPVTAAAAAPPPAGPASP